MSGTRARIALLLAVAVGLALGGPTAGSGTKRAPSATTAAAARPNIVFVLTDDLAWNLVRYMPHVQRMSRDGVTFSRYVVTDSLCCPSRSSIFTGLFPHDSGVFTNKGSDGGYTAFTAHGDEGKTFAIALHARGYLTSMMGKYLNGYDPSSKHLPPGWDDWHVAGEGYPEQNYDLFDSPPGQVDHFGRAYPPPPNDPANYLTDVLDTKAVAFVDRAAAAHRPFFMEVATFAPHAPYTPAPRNANDFPGLTEPRDPSFDANNVDPPSWLGIRKPLRPKLIGKIDAAFRMRAQAVEAVDRLIGDVEAALAAHGLAGDTYVVFSSDNGYHMGQHRLRPGKMTAFDTDIRVPLIVTGPGVARGRTVDRIAENIDLYPTFVQLAGGTPGTAVDGHSLVPLLQGQPVPGWRTVALVEHHGPATASGDPDFENGKLGGNPISYEAIRLGDATIASRTVRDAVYVEYANGEREYYDITRDPYERDNIWAQPGALSAAERAQLHATVAGLARCHGLAACWAAGRPR